MTDSAEASHVIRLDGAEVAVYAPNATAAHVCLFDETGEFADPRDAWQIETVARQVVDFAGRWAA